MATQLETLFQQFLKERKYLRNVSPQTIEWYETAWKYFNRSATPCLTTSTSLTRESLEQFVYGLRDRGVRPVTCNTWLRALNAFCRWLHERGFEFLYGFPQHLRKRRSILALQAVLDDSGTKGTGTVLMLGGLLGSAETMAEVSDEWDAELRAKIPLPLRYFKAYEARSLSGEFADWREQGRNEKVHRLCSVVDRSDLKLILCGVDLGPHRLTSQAYGKVTDFRHHPMNQPYLFALTLAMLTVTMEAEKTSEKFDVIVDEHVIFRSDALRFWDIVRGLAKPSLQELIPVQPLFRDDQGFLPLQAADLLMGHARMTLEKTTHWPVFDFKNLKTIGKFADAKSLGKMGARQMERNLGLPPNTLKITVTYPDGREEKA